MKLKQFELNTNYILPKKYFKPPHTFIYKAIKPKIMNEKLK